MYLDAYAERFAAAGLGALVFDNRNFGASDGEPRQEIDPWAQVRDYRHAITYAQHPARGRRRPDRRLGIELLRRARPRRRRDRPPGQGRGRPGAADLRLATTCARWSAPTSSPGSGRCSTPTARPATGARSPRWCPVVADDPLGAVRPADPGLLRRGSSRPARPRAPSWRNEVTLRSVEMFTEYEPGVYIDRISPTPLLMVVGAGGSPDRRRRGARRLRDGARAEEAACSCPAATSTPTSTTSTAATGRRLVRRASRRVAGFSPPAGTRVQRSLNEMLS